MELNKIISFLSRYPGFAGYRWETDCLPHSPQMATLTGQGIKTIDYIEDVLGNWKKTIGYTCTLVFSGNGKAQMLWDLQNWVARQSAPQLGQGRKTVSLREGRHLTKNKLGLDLYTAQLKLTYELFYEVNEHGEN